MRKVQLEVGDLIKDSVGYIGLVLEIKRDPAPQNFGDLVYFISAQNGERPDWYGEGYVRRCKVISKNR